MTTNLLNRVMSDPLNIAIATAAGAFGPAIVTRALPMAGAYPQLLPMACGAGAYYLVDDFKDTQALVIGGAAGYVGNMLKGGRF